MIIQGDLKMKKRSFSWKIVIGVLSLSLILIPVTSAISMEDQPATAGGVAGAGGVAQLTPVAKLGIAAIVVGVGIGIAIAIDDDDAVTAHSHHP